jgi:hypothetical protein
MRNLVKLFWSFSRQKYWNSWAIGRFFNKEKGRKNETNCIIYFKTFTRRIYNFKLQKTKAKKLNYF